MKKTTDSGYFFQKPIDFCPQTEEVVNINIFAFEKDWIKNDFYVGINGRSGNPHKYQYYKELCNKEASLVDMPYALYDSSEKQVGITQGRHRYSVYRDIGHRVISVVIPKNQKKYFQKYIMSN